MIKESDIGKITYQLPEGETVTITSNDTPEKIRTVQELFWQSWGKLRHQTSFRQKPSVSNILNNKLSHRK